MSSTRTSSEHRTRGPTGLVESAGRLLLALGHEADRIKSERFGPSGG